MALHVRTVPIRVRYPRDDLSMFFPSYSYLSAEIAEFVGLCCDPLYDGFSDNQH